MKAINVYGVEVTSETLTLIVEKLKGYDKFVAKTVEDLVVSFGVPYSTGEGCTYQYVANRVSDRLLRNLRKQKLISYGTDRMWSWN